VHQRSACDVDRQPGQIFRLFADQEINQIGDILDRSHPLQRNHVAEHFVFLLPELLHRNAFLAAVHGRIIISQIRGEKTRVDGVDIDFIWSQFHGERLRDADDGPLGSGIGSASGTG